MRRPAHLYKYCTAAVAKKILTNGSLRLSSPVLFNDPFDCYFAPGFSNPNRGAAEYAKRLDAILTRAEKLPADSPAAFGLAPLIHRMATVPTEVAARAHKSAKTRLKVIAESANANRQCLWERDVPRFRVLCLCAESTNPLLWAHYTDCHRGVAFEFDASKDAEMLFRKAEPVKYRKRPPRIYSQRHLVESALGIKPLPEDSRTALPLVMTKAVEWSYEKEWRNVLKSRADDKELFSYLPFRPSSLSRIFLGCHISSRNREAIMRLVTGHFSHVEIYEAYKTAARFGLGFRRVC